MGQGQGNRWVIAVVHRDSAIQTTHKPEIIFHLSLSFMIFVFILGLEPN